MRTFILFGGLTDSDGKRDTVQELLNEIVDERLKARLATAIGELRKTKRFGLVFEEHIPELVPIYAAKVRNQARVARKDKVLTDPSLSGE